MPEARSTTRKSPGRPRGSTSRARTKSADNDTRKDEDEKLDEENGETTTAEAEPASEDLSDVTFSRVEEPIRTMDGPILTPSSEMPAEPPPAPEPEPVRPAPVPER